jgi:peroxiredoxin
VGDKLRHTGCRQQTDTERPDSDATTHRTLLHFYPPYLPMKCTIVWHEDA